MPWLTFTLLTGISLSSAVLAGRGLAARPTRTWGHRVVFTGVLAFLVFVIADLDDPRRGFIKIEQTDQMLRDVRSAIN